MHSSIDEIHQEMMEEDRWRWAKRRAIGRMDISFGARECWRVLDGFREDSCYPSHWYIAQMLGRSQSAVCRYLRELEQHGYIEICPRLDDTLDNGRPRGQTSNEYVILEQSDLMACARQIIEEWNARTLSHKAKLLINQTR